MTRSSPPPADLAIVAAQLAAAPGWSRACALLPDPDAADPAMVDAILNEASRFADDVLAPLNDAMDRHGCRIEAGRVRTAPGHDAAWAQFVANGWATLGQPIDHGGQPLPTAIWAAVEGVFDRANPSFAMLPVPLISSARLIAAWADPTTAAQWLPRIVAAKCAATICISEPDAGSDVGRARTTARADGEGGWIIDGEKCWISFGDHDLAPRIVHCLLARTGDAASGGGGLSLFLVPDTLEDGTRNGVVIRRIEEKMGLHGSPTCALGFEGARGILLGQEGRGLAQMFVMIANMRLAVAIQGLGIASAVTDVAARYAAERRQGGRPAEPPVPITAHADVRRMLLEMASTTETLRGLILALANHVDIAARAPDAAERAEADLLAQWLLPIVKTAGAEIGFDVASTGVQVLGGAGYTREWPIEQGVRDARVLSVFEGTSGIQALDLMHRRLMRDDAASLHAFLRVARADADAAGPAAQPLHRALDQLEEAGAFLRSAERVEAEAGATAFLKLAILTAQGWIAARLVARGNGSPAASTLTDAGRYFLARLAPRAVLAATEAMAGSAVPATLAGS